jgi:muramoyltetrapeptide carboxypeptidase LdcA involved in peptidoglycan recycling
MRLERPAVRRQTAPRAPKLIAVVAPANTMKHIDPRLVELGRRALEELGFVVQFGAHVLSEGKFGVAPLPERLADMQWAMSDPAIDLVMPAYGGYNSNQLLPYLDYNLARQTQKTYIGFSDLSALLIALRPASFLRDLTHLTQVPEFFEIRGLLIGSFPDGSKLADHGTLVSILDELLGHSKFPVLCGVSCSHVDPMMTLPLFEQITLHAEENPKLVLPGRKNVHCHDSRNQLMG